MTNCCSCMLDSSVFYKANGSARAGLQEDVLLPKYLPLGAGVLSNLSIDAVELPLLLGVVLVLGESLSRYHLTMSRSSLTYPNLLGEYGIPMEWNFLFKRDYWQPSKNRSQTSISNQSSASDQTDNSMEKAYSTGAAILHVKNLVKKFGPDKVAVNHVSFDLYANQITSLLGPNGSGKTTIFNCLIGIYQPTSGAITMASEDGVEHDAEKEIELLRKYIGYCPPTRHSLRSFDHRRTIGVPCCRTRFRQA